MGSAPRLGGSGYSSFLGPGIAGGYGYGYGGGFGGPVVVQRSDGGGGLITILVVVAAFLLVTSVASQFLNGGDGEGSSGMFVCTRCLKLLCVSRKCWQTLTTTSKALH